MRLLIARSIFPKVVFDSLTAQIKVKSSPKPDEYKIAKYAKDGVVDQIEALNKSANEISVNAEKYCALCQKVLILSQFIQ
jgi:hypothetical protein